MLPALAEQGQLLVLASAISQVCLLCQSLSGLQLPLFASGVSSHAVSFYFSRCSMLPVVHCRSLSVYSVLKNRELLPDA